MSLIKIKAGVMVSQQVVIAAGVVNAANQLGLPVDMVITSGRDGTHKVGSLHYYDKALDFRTKHLIEKDKTALTVTVKKRLGPDYDVILESRGKTNEHLHVEHDPAPR